MKMFLLAASLVLSPPANQEKIKIIDGDTFVLNGEKIRLIGIDAPELSGKCPKTRECPLGNPIASKQNLEKILSGGEIEIERIGLDNFGRTIANVWAGKTNASCAQIKNGFAIYIPKWDKLEKLNVCAIKSN